MPKKPGPQNITMRGGQVYTPAAPPRDNKQPEPPPPTKPTEPTEPQGPKTESE